MNKVNSNIVRAVRIQGYYNPHSRRRALTLSATFPSRGLASKSTINTYIQTRPFSSSSSLEKEVTRGNENDMKKSEISKSTSASEFTSINNHDKDGNDDNDDDDSSSNSKQNTEISILGANPQPNPPEIEEAEQLKRERGYPWREALPLAWAEYKSTWDGFFTSNQKKEYEKEEKEEEYDDKESFLNEENIKQTQKDMHKNIKRNVKVLKKEGSNALETVKDITGIQNKNDLTRFAMEQLKLTNECLAEFMAGYRKSRDEEVDKMMNEYFKDLEDGGSGDKEKKKKIKVDEESKPKSGRRKRTRRSKWS
jgi:hypothetical protein